MLRIDPDCRKLDTAACYARAAALFALPLHMRDAFFNKSHGE